MCGENMWGEEEVWQGEGKREGYDGEGRGRGMMGEEGYGREASHGSRCYELLSKIPVEFLERMILPFAAYS